MHSRLRMTNTSRLVFTGKYFELNPTKKTEHTKSALYDHCIQQTTLQGEQNMYCETGYAEH
uniref:Uncharacterized protein n=1 Tax=Anguilla anguilla TaxID=7936 RepID=A0A0E9QU88_ANGAN